MGCWRFSYDQPVLLAKSPAWEWEVIDSEGVEDNDVLGYEMDGKTLSKKLTLTFQRLKQTDN